MGKNHYQKYHSTEGRIKWCLRCIINSKSEVIQSQNEIIQSQTEKIEKLEYSLDESNCQIDHLLDEIGDLKNDLRLALDRKEHYREMYYIHKE